MPFPSVAWSTLALVAGLSLPTQSIHERPTSPQSQWKPLFDYTNLQPASTELWDPLSKVQVPMEAAIELAKQTETGTVRTLKAELKPGPEGAAWQLELFVGDEAPKRVNLSISTVLVATTTPEGAAGPAQPKVLKRLELRSITAEEQQLWTVFAKIRVPAEDSIEIAKKAAFGHKPEPRISDMRMRTLVLSHEKDVAMWHLELMGVDKRQQLRRYSIGVDTKNPNFKFLKLLDRFAGTPVRNKGVPTELENGMVIYDFRPGEGEELQADTEVEVNYRLWLLDNTKLHDTWGSKLPETFAISQAPLEGMRQGMAGMKVGGRRKICIPYAMAFGEAGNEIAPRKAMVVCDIHINKLADGGPSVPDSEPPEEPGEDELDEDG